MKIIERFEIPYYQYLNENSELADEIPVLAEKTDELRELYKLMLLVRTMDAKAIALQRTGKLGTYPSTRGQEAVFVGVGYAMAKEDIYVPYYRDMGALIQRGVKLSQILLYWGGDERGNVYDAGCEDFPFCVPIGSQALHAVGAAYAIKYRKDNHAVVSMCGEGATSQGDVYEAMNVAAVWKLPVVFIVCNNQWAISVPREAQTAAATIAQKAIAAGMYCEQVDGNDMLAVQERTSVALERARRGEPSVIEMVCYRQHDHTTADDASRYEPSHLRAQEWVKEPIGRLKKYLEAQGVWSQQDEEATLIDCAKEVDAAVQEYLNVAPQPRESMFDSLYATLPEAYASQRDVLMAMEESSHG